MSQKRWFTGWASVEEIDIQGEKIAMEAFEKVMEDYLAIGGPIIDTHSNKTVGRVIEYEFKKKKGVPGLWIKGEIYDRYESHDEVWEGIKSGHYKGLSMGGKNKDAEANIVCEGEKCFNHIKNIELFEISVVDKPANRNATIEEVNHVAKRNNGLFKKICPNKQDIPCPDCVIVGKTVGDILKPSAFDRCVEHLEGDPDIDNPHAVCMATVDKLDSNVSQAREESKINGGTHMPEDKKKKTEEAVDASLKEKTETEEAEKQDEAPDAMTALMERLDSLEQRITAMEESKTAQDEEEEEEKPEEEKEEDEEEDEEKKLKDLVEKEVAKKFKSIQSKASENTNRPKMAKTAPVVGAQKEITGADLLKLAKNKRRVIEKIGM